MSYTSYDIESRRKAKMRADDRVIVLRPMKDKPTLSSTGMVDNRLFTGENKLHAIFDNRLGMWYLKYEIGGLPEALQNRFTTFTDLQRFVTEYYKKRNIEIVKVID